MAGEEVTMDEQIIQELTDSVINNEFVQNALDVYVRTLQGIGQDDDVSDNSAYWEEFSRKLQNYIIRMVPSLVKEYKYDQIVF